MEGGECNKDEEEREAIQGDCKDKPLANTKRIGDNPELRFIENRSVECQLIHKDLGENIWPDEIVKI